MNLWSCAEKIRQVKSFFFLIKTSSSCLHKIDYEDVRLIWSLCQREVKNITKLYGWTGKYCGCSHLRDLINLVYANRDKFFYLDFNFERTTTNSMMLCVCVIKRKKTQIGIGEHSTEMHRHKQNLHIRHRARKKKNCSWCVCYLLKQKNFITNIIIYY